MTFPHPGWEGLPIHCADHPQSRKDGLLFCFEVNVQLVAALCPCAAQPSPLLSARLGCELASEWVYTLMPALFLFLQPCEHRTHEERVFLNLTSQVTGRRAQCSLYFQAEGGENLQEQGVTKCARHTGIYREKQHLRCNPLQKKNFFHMKFIWKNFNKSWEETWPI